MVEIVFPQPVLHVADFYDRTDELEQVRQALFAPAARSVVVLGERRIGKTSFLNVTLQRLRGLDERVIPLFIAHTGLHSAADFAREILLLLCADTGQDPAAAGLDGFLGDFSLTSLTAFTQALAGLIATAPDHRYVIAVDEFDALLNPNEGLPPAEALRVLDLVGTLIQNPAGLPVVFLLAMANLPAQNDPSFSNLLISEQAGELLRRLEENLSRCEVVELAPFSRGDMEAMIHGLVGSDYEFHAGALEEMYRLSGGHPYLTKLLLTCLNELYKSEVEALQAQHKAAVVTPVRVQRALRLALEMESVGVVLANIYNIQLSPLEQGLLLLITERGGRLSSADADLLGPPFIAAARRLRRRGYVTSDESGGICMRTDFLRIWLQDWDRYETEINRHGVDDLVNLL